jgi:hypothetical protein
MTPRYVAPIPIPDSRRGRLLRRIIRAAPVLRRWRRFAAAAAASIPGEATEFDDLAEALDAVLDHLAQEWPTDRVEIGERFARAPDRKLFEGAAFVRVFALVERPGKGKP